MMQQAQIEIVSWMRQIMQKHGLTPNAWAVRAKLGRDTVSRAMKDDYQFVTTTATLEKLAAAVGEPLPHAAAVIPSEEALMEILKTLQVALGGSTPLGEDDLRLFAGALRDTLLGIADEPDLRHDRRLATALARQAVRRRHSLPDESVHSGTKGRDA